MRRKNRSTKGRYAASKAYNQLVKGSPEWLALEEAWREQKDKPGGKHSIHGYFISQHMKQANTP